MFFTYILSVIASTLRTPDRIRGRHPVHHRAVAPARRAVSAGVAARAATIGRSVVCECTDVGGSSLHIGGSILVIILLRHSLFILLFILLFIILFIILLIIAVSLGRPLWFAAPAGRWRHASRLGRSPRRCGAV